jgi:pyruvate/2-oxoglutarate dehydrogenase complex dihydrolipoamide dehydrogenase (E3) component
LATPEFDIVVIGGGSAGLVVAAGGAQLGARIALVEKHKMGGDCLNYGCVPSKTLIKSARVAHLMRTADRFAIAPAEPRVRLPDVMERVAEVIAGIAPNDSPERFRGLGVDVIFGSGRFVDRETVAVGDRRLTARHFVIATGSRAALPPVPGLAAVPYLTNETLFSLREEVPALIVIGGGPIGSEMAQAFARLGSKVSLVDMGPGILPREDRDLAEPVRAAMAADGVDFHFETGIVRVEGGRGDIRVVVRGRDGVDSTLHATHLLVAAGRAPNVEGLGLDAAGVALEKGRIVVDAHLRTSNPRIYAAGDAAGGLQFTHLAGHHAGVVLRQTLFRLFWAKPSPLVPWCTYTDPELARAGLSEAEAVQRGIAHRVYRFPYEEIDRARAEGETAGFAKIVTDPKGRLLGAAIVGAHAGELINEYALAIARGMKAGDVSGVIHVYPTFAEINKRVADQRLKEGLTPTSRAWIKRIFRLRGG